MNDTAYMRIAYNLALKAKGKTSPNPLVGALVVKKGRIIAQGYHRRCGGDHAEIIALKKAGRRAKGATLYVTLEPCGHYGRTSPCVETIIQSGIKKVVVGMKDPNPVNNGRSIQKLKRARIKTKVGFLKSELSRMNEPFIKYIKQKMPFVVAKCAQTIDGKIATAIGQSKWITSRKTRQWSHNVRNEFDAILVGANTVRKDNPALNATQKSKRLKKIIVDSNLSISPKAKLFFRAIPQDIFLATTKKASKKRIQLFAKKGVHIIICPGKKGQVHLKYLFKALAKQEIAHILIEGGGEIIGHALKEKLVDKMLIILAFKMIGDQNAISSIKGLNIQNVNKAIRLSNVMLKQIDNDLVMEAYVCRNR